ncbi:MAG: hypothetical protein ACRCXH_01600 [Shewanella sp.]
MPNLTSHQLSEFAEAFIHYGWRGVENIFGRRNTINKMIVDHLDRTMGLREMRKEYRKANGAR